MNILTRTLIILSAVASVLNSSCNSEKKDPTKEEAHTFIYQEADSVVFYGDTAFIEYKVLDSKTINHFVLLDSNGKVTFRNFSVSVSRDISPSDSIYQDKGNNIKFNPYKIVYNDNYSWTEAIRNGLYNIYKNDSIQSVKYVTEEITEGNGTYHNTLKFDENKKSPGSYVLFKHYDPHLKKSYSWEYENLTPMTWDEYQRSGFDPRKITEIYDSLILK